MQKIKRGIQFIIFDLDGTLVDSKNDIIQAVNFTLRKIGVEERKSHEISSYIGTGVHDLLKKSLGGKKDLFFEKALSVFQEYFSTHYADTSILYPNVKKILNYFKDKKKVIVTNRNHQFAVLTLKALGIYKYFIDVVGGDDVECSKPNACPLNKALSKFKVKKEKAIIVGDMDLDVLAGKEAGILTCAVTYGLGKKEDIVKADPDYIIDDIIELKKVID